MSVFARQFHRTFYSKNLTSIGLKNSFKKNHEEKISNGVFIIRKLSTKSDDLSHLSESGSIPLVNLTIGQLAKKAVDNFPNREIIVSIPQGIRMTFKDVLQRADKIAAGLKKLGLKYGDRVGVWGPNDIEWFLSFLAITRGGFIIVAINPAYQQLEFNHCADRVGAKVIISSSKFKTQDYIEMVKNYKKISKTLEHIIFWTENHVTGAHRLTDIESLANKIEVEEISKTQENISTFDPCNIQFTSGSTGLPKAVLLSHNSFVNNGIMLAEREQMPKNYDRCCMNVPFFHAFGMIQGFMAALHSGSTLIVESQSFNPKASIDAIVKEKCTVIFGTPTMWINMTNIQNQLRAPFNKIRMGVTGGASASSEMMKNVKKILKVENLTTLYGQTEITGIIFTSMPGESEELTYTTVGRIASHVEVKVVDEKGDIVPFGTAGELLVRGYMLMLKYWDDPDATSKTIDKDGWLKTGDKFILKKDGYGQIVGRIKDVIIRGGENIYPKEIENFLEKHPAILEAHVFGVYDKIYGEEVCACIRLREKMYITSDEIKNYSKGKISYFKIPKYIEFYDEFPKTTSGKIQKFKLKKNLEEKGIVPFEIK